MGLQPWGSSLHPWADKWKEKQMRMHRQTHRDRHKHRHADTHIGRHVHTLTHMPHTHTHAQAGNIAQLLGHPQSMSLQPWGICAQAPMSVMKHICVGCAVLASSVASRV